MDLLRNALKTIRDGANAYLQNLDPRPDEWVVLTSLVGHDGSLNASARDKIVMTVYNITRESFASAFRQAVPASANAGSGSGMAVVSPPIFLNLHVMFMANFAERAYEDGLAALSRLVSFFQQFPTFTTQNAPELSASIDKLTLDYENLSPVDVNYVMSTLGTRYLPSAYYKIRMVPFLSSTMQERAYPVAGAGLDGGAASAQQP